MIAGRGVTRRRKRAMRLQILMRNRRRGPSEEYLLVCCQGHPQTKGYQAHPRIRREEEGGKYIWRTHAN